MADTTILKPFSGAFISDFGWTPQTLPFTNEEIMSIDRELSVYEQVFLNPDIEKSLISKNELLASFAISKAEDSELTLEEAQDVYNLILSDPNYDFIREKLWELIIKIFIALRITITSKKHDIISISFSHWRERI